MMENLKELSAQLTKRLEVDDVSVRVDEQAAKVIEALGTEWMVAAILPLTITIPRAEVVLKVHLQDSEPMLNLSTPYSYDFASGYSQGFHGEIVIRSSGPEVSSDIKQQRKVLALPTLELLEGRGDFTFARRDGRLKRVLSKVYSEAYKRTPLLLDTYRQSRNAKWGYYPEPVFRWFNIMPYEPDMKCMWIAMHWAEAGGAESWAFEQARLAKEAGYRVIMTFDRIAPQRMFKRAQECSDVVMFTTHALDDGDDQRVFIPRMLKKYRVGRIHIHHSFSAYNAARDIKLALPQVVIDDTTHITEHRGGGFVTLSRHKSDAIDLHHVISPLLRDTYLLEAGANPEKVVYRPLTRMGGHEQVISKELSARDSSKPLRIGFLGRLSLQKRPYLFVETVKALHDKFGDQVEFLMQGSGDLDAYTTQRIKDLGLENVIERRSWGPVPTFMESVDILLISSDNEGLTLTTIEASAAGVLVLSADVGSQRSVVPAGALLPAMPLPFRKQAVHVVSKILKNPEVFNALLEDQLEMATRLQSLQSASEFFADRYKEADKSAADSQKKAK
ncbi:glycosyltransferase [Actinomycetaceae bacterium TAE3-ERU4]|nr:glycosyltransferase [Actinomycetaceae bacterium TAE3-ERU4]